MSGRFPSSTRLRLEALEDRCNPSTLDPTAGALAAPPDTDAGWGSWRYPAAFNSKGTTNASTDDLIVNAVINSAENAETSDPTTVNWHGTHVAGTVGATANNRGVNYDKLVVHIWTNQDPGRGDDVLIGGAGTDRDDTSGQGTPAADGGDSDGTVAMSGYIKIKKLSQGG